MTVSYDFSLAGQPATATGDWVNEIGVRAPAHSIVKNSSASKKIL